MNLLIKLGFRNIGRNRGRTFLTMTAVILCSGGLTAFSIYSAGLIKMMTNTLVRQSGHIRIIHKEVAKNARLAAGQYFVGDANKIMEKVGKLDTVKQVVARVDLGGLLERKGKTAPAMGFAVDPEKEKETLSLKSKIVKGRMFKNKGKEVILGYRLAERLKVKLNDKIVLIGKTVDDSMSALKLKVVGFFSFGITPMDKTFYTNLPNGQYMLDLNDQASSMLIYTKDYTQAQQVAKKIAGMNITKNIVVQSWKELPIAKSAITQTELSIFVLGGIIVFIGAIGLLNTMTMSVLERKGEVGLMMALGFSPAKIANLFLIEGFVLGFLGSGIGVLLSVIACYPLVTKGISLPAKALERMPINMTETIYGAYTLDGILLGLIVGALTAFAGTVLPALKASQMQPVEALRK